MSVLTVKLERKKYPRELYDDAGRYSDLYCLYIKEISQGLIEDGKLIRKTRMGEYTDTTFVQLYKVCQEEKTYWVVLRSHIGSCEGCVGGIDTEEELDEKLDQILSRAYISEDRTEVEEYYAKIVKKIESEDEDEDDDYKPISSSGLLDLASFNKVDKYLQVSKE